jgi:hypothetical protein
MAQHKWHKEIKCFIDGGEVERKNINGDEWYLITDIGEFSIDYMEYRIKPQPQYLYVWLDKDTQLAQLETYEPKGVLEDDLYKYIGKIKLENDNGND